MRLVVFIFECGAWCIANLVGNILNVHQRYDDSCFDHFSC